MPNTTSENSASAPDPMQQFNEAAARLGFPIAPTPAQAPVLAPSGDPVLELKVPLIEEELSLAERVFDLAVDKATDAAEMAINPLHVFGVEIDLDGDDGSPGVSFGSVLKVDVGSDGADLSVDTSPKSMFPGVIGEMVERGQAVVDGATIDLDDSDGSRHVKVDLDIVKVEVEENENGTSASAEIEVEYSSGGSFGIKGDVAFDADGNLTSVGGSGELFIPVGGVPIGGEAGANYRSTDDGYEIGGTVSAGAKLGDVDARGGYHVRYEDAGGDDYEATVGRHQSVTYEHEGTGTEIELKNTTDIVFGEHQGDRSIGVRIGGEANVTVEDVDIVRISGDIGVTRTSGSDGTHTTLDAGGSIGFGSEDAPLWEGSGRTSVELGSDTAAVGDEDSINWGTDEDSISGGADTDFGGEVCEPEDLTQSTHDLSMPDAL
jgi:hypothetical protein